MAIKEEQSQQEAADLLQNVDTAPELQAAFSVMSAFDEGSMDIGKVLKQFHRAADAVNNGNMSGPERMAMCQAKILDMLFNELLRRGMAMIDQPEFETIMKLALKAQAQSAKALETIAILKKPAIFAKQLNMAHQQVVSNTQQVTASHSAPPMLDANSQHSTNLVRLAGKSLPPTHHGLE